MPSRAGTREDFEARAQEELNKELSDRAIYAGFVKSLRWELSGRVEDERGICIGSIFVYDDRIEAMGSVYRMSRGPIHGKICIFSRFLTYEEAVKMLGERVSEAIAAAALAARSTKIRIRKDAVID